MYNSQDGWTKEDEVYCRVIGIIDMDAFEVQIYLKLQYPANSLQIYHTLPVVLTVQRSSRILSLNYRAKELGIDRSLSWKEALEISPELLVLTKEEEHGKPETRNLRRTSHFIHRTILEYREKYQIKFLLELASPDEFYLDLTDEVDDIIIKHLSDSAVNDQSIGPNTYLENETGTFKCKQIVHRFSAIRDYTNRISERRLIIGATLMEEIRQLIYTKTKYLSSSCGIGSNKLLAKLACRCHKPSGITILPKRALGQLSLKIRVDSIPGLKGKIGQRVVLQAQKWLQTDKTICMRQLNRLNVRQLIQVLECGPFAGQEIYGLLSGECSKAVQEKSKPLTITSSKKVQGQVAFRDCLTVETLLFDLYKDLCDKLEDDESWNHRSAVKVTASLQLLSYNQTYSIKFYVDPKDNFSLFDSFDEMYSNNLTRENGNDVLNHIELKASF